MCVLASFYLYSSIQNQCTTFPGIFRTFVREQSNFQASCSKILTENFFKSVERDITFENHLCKVRFISVADPIPSFLFFASLFSWMELQWPCSTKKRTKKPVKQDKIEAWSLWKWNPEKSNSGGSVWVTGRRAETLAPHPKAYCNAANYSFIVSNSATCSYCDLI